MTNEQNLLSDLAEIHADLAEWAKDQMSEGKTADDIRAAIREAARLTGRA
jgi:hypothetical protein